MKNHHVPMVFHHRSTPPSCSPGRRPPPGRVGLRGGLPTDTGSAGIAGIAGWRDINASITRCGVEGLHLTKS